MRQALAIFPTKFFIATSLGRISLASDSFYISSGSLSVPNNAEFRLTDVTGSDDASYQSGTRTYGLIFPLVFSSSF